MVSSSLIVSEGVRSNRTGGAPLLEIDDLKVYYQTVAGTARAVDGVRLTGIEEKPEQRFLVNAGIYAVSPSALDLVPPATGSVEIFGKTTETGAPAAAPR